MDDTSRVVIISPHADDAVIGCGGLLLWCAERGIHVKVLLGDLNGTDKEFKEFGAAMKMLGVKDTAVLMAECGISLDQVAQRKLVGMLNKEFASFDPTHVFVPPYSNHQDHRALYDASFAATRPNRNSSSVLVYEGYSRWHPQDQFSPNVFLDIEPYLEKKLDALRVFKSQTSTGSIRIESVEMMAKYHGSFIGKNAVEAFECRRLLL